MLPTRAYPDASLAAAFTPAAQPQTERPVIVVAAADADVDQFPASQFTRLSAHTTADVMRLLERTRPRVVAIDWDLPDLDAPEICWATQRFGHPSLLVTTGYPDRAPAALKAGCHAILLKPLTRNLVAGRIGRLCREVSTLPISRRAAAALQQEGTNRVWPDTACPKCHTPGATSFEFSSYRRMWYACLGCEAVWLGKRQE